MKLLAIALVACHSSPPPVTGPEAGQGAEAGMPDAPVVATRLVAYASGGGPDLVAYEVDPAAGTLTRLGATPAFAATPSFVAFAPDGRHLYAVSEGTDRLGAYAIDPATAALTFVNDVSSGGSGPAHVAVDRGGRFALVANYGDGKVAVIPIDASGAVGAPLQIVTAGKNAHQVVLDATNHFAFVPCLGVDYVAQYTFDPTTGMLAANATPHMSTAAGAGPRHLAFAPDQRFAYLLDEVASTVSMLAFDATTGRLSLKQTLSTLPAPVSGNTGAEVVVDPTGRVVWTSNRGANTIARFSADATTGMLTYAGATPTTGATPRNFALVDPALMLVANQGAGTIVPFSVEPGTGVLAPHGAAVMQPSPQFVGAVALPR